MPTTSETPEDRLEILSDEEKKLAAAGEAFIKASRIYNASIRIDPPEQTERKCKALNKTSDEMDLQILEIMGIKIDRTLGNWVRQIEKLVAAENHRETYDLFHKKRQEAIKNAEFVWPEEKPFRAL